MTLFGLELEEIEAGLLNNLKKTKAIFPDEIKQIEIGLALMRNLTQITKEASKEYPSKPNLFTNHNLFARNRQLLVNAYVSLLFSTYGTEFVILRTVLENNNLMRLFNKNSRFAFEWLPIDLQKRFSEEIRIKYGASRKHDEEYSPSFVRNEIFGAMEKKKVKEDIADFYNDLCNYTHPNFAGWKELIIQKEDGERIQNIPCFLADDGDIAIGALLFSMQATFKSFVETFKGYLFGFAYQLETWQVRNRELLLRHLP